MKTGINPFTKKEHKNINFKEAITAKIPKKQNYQEQIDTLTKQVSEMQDAFKAIAGADTKSIANIRAIAKRFVEEEET